jgi:hypothetical protein
VTTTTENGLRIHQTSGISHIAFGFAVLSVSCSAATVPAETGALYVLQSVAGQSLPAVFADDILSRYVMAADSLWLRTDGTGKQITADSTWCGRCVGTQERHGRVAREFTYAIRAGEIELRYVVECNDTPGMSGSCAPNNPVFGEFAATGITLGVHRQVTHTDGTYQEYPIRRAPWVYATP